MTAIPYTYEPRPETRVTNIRFGIWMLLASEAMFFGSLFSAYVLLYAGAGTWADTRTVLSLQDAATLSTLLVLATRFARDHPWRSAAFGVLFLVSKSLDYVNLWSDGIRPATNLMAASWFVLTGIHWLHVLGGTMAGAWCARAASRVAPPHHFERLRALRLYWLFLDLVWIGILACFFFS